MEQDAVSGAKRTRRAAGALSYISSPPFPRAGLTASYFSGRAYSEPRVTHRHVMTATVVISDGLAQRPLTRCSMEFRPTVVIPRVGRWYSPSRCRCWVVSVRNFTCQTTQAVSCEVLLVLDRLVIPKSRSAGRGRERRDLAAEITLYGISYILHVTDPPTSRVPAAQCRRFPSYTSLSYQEP